MQRAWSERGTPVQHKFPGAARSALLKVSQDTNLSGNLTLLIKAALLED